MRSLSDDVAPLGLDQRGRGTGGRAERGRAGLAGLVAVLGQVPPLRRGRPPPRQQRRVGVEVRGRHRLRVQRARVVPGGGGGGGQRDRHRQQRASRGLLQWGVWA